MKLNRPAISHDCANVRTTDKSQVLVIEIVAAEIVDHRSAGARRHERVNVDALVHKNDGSTCRLIAVITTDYALACLGVVGLANP